MRGEIDLNKGNISYAQGIALYLGAVLGSGILILPGYTAEVAGPAAILSWAALSVLSIPLAYTFTRLALRYRDLGGIATIVGHAFGPAWGAVSGWFYFCMVCIGDGVVALTGAGYLVSVFHWPETTLYILAMMFVLCALTANLLGMKNSGRLSLLLSGLVLVVLITTVVLALPGISAGNFVPFLPWGLHGVGKACVLIFWSFFGWESITHLVPEFRDPKRDVMRSMWASVLIIGIVYSLLALVTVGTHTYGQQGSLAPLAMLMHQTLGVNAGLATTAVVCIVCVGTANVYFASTSRLGYAMAREGNFPAWFGILDQRGIPARCVWLLFAANATAILCAFIFNISMDKLILVPTMLGIAAYIILSLASVKLLWQDKIGRISSITATACCIAVTPFARGYILVPVLVAVACLAWRKLQNRELCLYPDEDPLADSQHAT